MNPEIYLTKLSVNDDEALERAAIEALASEYPDARAVKLYSLKSAEEFYRRIGFDRVSPSTKKCLSLWRKRIGLTE